LIDFLIALGQDVEIRVKRTRTEICPAPVPTVPDNYDQRRRDCGRGIA